MKRFLVILTVAALFSCSQKVNKESVMKKAYKMYERGEYSDARKYLKEAIYRAEGLTTKELLKLRYMLANSYYLDEDYVDAIVEFEEFLALFPTAPQVPEVLYKLADSYMKVSPGAERDLTYVKKAEEKAEELVENYPDTIYAKKAKQIIKKAKLIEAQHLIDIAVLYEKLGKPYAASVYYQKAYDEFGDYLDKKKIEFKIGEDLVNSYLQYQKELEEYKNKIKEVDSKIKKEKDIEKRNVLINRKQLLEEHVEKIKDRIKDGQERGIKILEYVVKNYPDSNYAEKAKKILKKFKKEKND